jgi:hypothetical protein
MKFTAMKHRVLAAQAHCTPAGTVIRVQGGLPPEGPATAPGEPVDAPPSAPPEKLPPAPESSPTGS